MAEALLKTIAFNLATEQVECVCVQALYNLFAAYVHTMPLAELLESVERARLDAKLRYVVI